MSARPMRRRADPAPLAGLLATVLLLACGGDEPGTAKVTTPVTGFFVVTPPEGMDFTRAQAISRDGTAVVGVAGLGSPGWDAFHWSATGPRAGQVTWLHPPAVDRQGGLGVVDVIVSADGNHVAGDVFGTTSNSLFAWDADKGQVGEWAHLHEALANVRLGFDESGAHLFASGRQTSLVRSAEGVQTLSIPAGAAGVQITGITEDGGALAGNLLLDGRNGSENDDVTTLFRSSGGTAVEALPLPAGMATCRSDGWMNRTADVLFATCKSDLSKSDTGLFRWNAEGGWEVLRAPAPDTEIRVEAADDAGTTLTAVALPLRPSAPGEPEARTHLLRWTLQAGCEDLPPPAGAEECASYGDELRRIGPTGAVVGTCATSGGGHVAVTWDAAGRAAILNPLPADQAIEVVGASDDVHIVAGASLPANDGRTTQGKAVVWVLDPSAFGSAQPVQPQSAEDFLHAVLANVDLRGLTLRTASVSRDGKSLWGAATDETGHARAWIAHLL